MGFGLCVLGYLLVIFDSFLGGIPGWLLLIWGMWKLSSVNKDFRIASFIAAACFAYSIIDLLTFAEIIDSGSKLYFYAHMIYLVLSAVFHAVYLLSIRTVALEGGSQTLGFSAMMWLIFTGIYYIIALAVMFVKVEDITTFSSVMQIMKYVIGAFNLWFLYTCYAQITTERQIKKDNEFFRKEKEKTEAKKKKK